MAEKNIVLDSMAQDRKKRFNKVFLIASACVLVAALAVSAVILAGNHTSAMRIMDYGTVLRGVSINGIDVSSMTMDEAAAATADIEDSLLAQANFQLDVDGEVFEFKAQELGIVSDYQDILSQAISYGHWGTFEERSRAADAASTEGINLLVTLSVDETKLNAALAEFKAAVDAEPQNATAMFCPWGYTAGMADDGTVTYTKYEPDLDTIKEMCNTYAKGNEYEHPELVRISDEEMPIALRYQYYNDSKYEEDYIPTDTNIARFLYVPEVTGIIVDTDAVHDTIVNQVETGEYSTITVPVEITEPEVKLEDVKNNTHLIASWTSSYRGHYGYNRNYNVAMISSIFNGSVIMPGETWSANNTTGSRNSSGKYGWKKAPGIENGGYTDQYGGGVCQLGSTTYNAAIRSGITIEDYSHHTIPSNYIPYGLDATLSTPKPDLVLKNDNTLPYYIVSYVNPKDKNVTVEIYGPPLTDPDHPEWGEVIYDFESDYIGRFGSPASKVIESSEPITAPDGTVVNADNPEYVYSENRRGTKARVYKHVYSLDGTELADPIEYEYAVYKVINGTTYKYNPPAPSPTPSPAPSPT